MRESFIIIISLLKISVRCSNLESDSYNFYKDHTRARSTEPLKISPVINSWDSYASLQGDGYNMPWLSGSEKRAMKAVKMRMLDKLRDLDDRLSKRTSKAALSLMLQSKPDTDHTEEEHNCFAGK